MLNLEDLNAMSRDEFTQMIGPIFEHSPWIAERTWPRRPFMNREDLFAALRQTVVEATENERLRLIRAHPDLASRMKLTEASEGEQRRAGLDQLSAKNRNLFADYNERYRQKFGFPFVICARLNKTDAILNAFPKRLQNSLEKEKETALDEVYKIAELRLREIVE